MLMAENTIGKINDGKLIVFSEWYKDNGNPPGGFELDEIPTEFKELIPELERKNYIRYWNEPKRVILRVRYRIPYNWDKLFRQFFESCKKKGYRYKEIVDFYMLHFELDHHYLDGEGIPRNDEDREKAYKAKKKYLYKYIHKTPIDEIEEYVFNHGIIGFSCKYIEGWERLISELSKAETEDEIENILSYDFQNNKYISTSHGVRYFNFSYGMADIYYLANVRDKEKIKKAIDTMGQRGLNKNDYNNPYVINLFSF